MQQTAIQPQRTAPAEAFHPDLNLAAIKRSNALNRNAPAMYRVLTTINHDVALFKTHVDPETFAAIQDILADIRRASPVHARSFAGAA